MIKRMISKGRESARKKRGKIFLKYLQPTSQDKILDLGGDDGAYMADIFPKSERDNIYIGDIRERKLKKAERLYGFKTMLLREDGGIPTGFDIIFCSSVIEHVTIPKKEIYNLKSGQTFESASYERQKQFAQEIQNSSSRYFVQTPYKYFLIESHTWLPFIIVFLPRKLQIKFIQFINKFWIKPTQPDFYLLTTKQLQHLFPDAKIVKEKFLGMTKSIIAVKT
ncbi:MAG: class I SAM-dependent methyltransferase [Bacteroidota bacterium]